MLTLVISTRDTCPYISDSGDAAGEAAREYFEEIYTIHDDEILAAVRGLYEHEFEDIRSAEQDILPYLDRLHASQLTPAQPADPSTLNTPTPGKLDISYMYLHTYGHKCSWVT